MSIIAWFFVCIALYGTYLNSNCDYRGFYYWLISNTAFTILNFNDGSYAQAFLFSIYTLLAIRGLFQWQRNS